MPETWLIQTAERIIRRDALKRDRRADRIGLLASTILHVLVDDRHRVSARLIPFYDNSLSGRHTSGNRLLSAVVSFDATMRERVAPTEFGDSMTRRINFKPKYAPWSQDGGLRPAVHAKLVEAASLYLSEPDQSE